MEGKSAIERAQESLLPCPFCGGQAVATEKRGSPTMQSPGPLYSVEIEHWCRESSPVAGVTHTSIKFNGRDHEAAVSAWNRRAVKPEQPNA